jgi:hypothetical protein
MVRSCTCNTIENLKNSKGQTLSDSPERNVMNNPEDLNLKMLERSLEQHESARSNFFRDLKFAGVVLLLFQFLVFFKFASLSDEKLEVRTRLTKAETNQRALADVQLAVGSIKTVLKKAAEGLTNSLTHVPSDIRDQLSHLAEELEEFRGQPFQLPPQRPAFVQDNAPVASRSALERIFLAGFTESEKKTLHDANTEENAYQDLVVRIVETKIIQPEFQRLNAAKENLLAKPLASGMADLRNLSDQLTTLRKSGIDVDSWLTNVEGVVTLAAGLKFSAPAASKWWSSRQSKADFASEAQLNTAGIVGQAIDVLSGPERDLKSLSQKIEMAVTGLKQEGEQIEGELLKLQTNANSIETLLQSYAKPLAVVALEPKDLVLYYPVILAAILSMFAFRQMLLRRRAEVLASAYSQLGLSDNILEVCFTDLPGPMQGELSLNPAARAKSPWRFVGLLWVVPTGFAVTSFVWILASKSLNDQAPRLLYLASALVLAATCLLVLRFSHNPKRPEIREN